MICRVAAKPGSLNGLLIFVVATMAICLVRGECQQPQPAASNAAETEDRLNKLAEKVAALQEQLKLSQSEVEALSAELKSFRAEMSAKGQGEAAAHDATALQASVDEIREQASVLQAEIQQHDQTKIESASKYPVRLSGTLLFTSMLNRGNPDDIDVPMVALPNQTGMPASNLSATLRQTIVGLDAIGPHLWGAKSSADISVDLFGAIPYGDYSATAGSLRMRTAHAMLEWPTRSLAFALDRPLISPWQPTSWLSVGEPALAWAGNLWTWSPQLEYSQDNVIGRQHVRLQLGLIDPSDPSSGSTNGLRTADAAELSKQPGYEGHIGNSANWAGRAISFGAGGYYDRQTYKYDAHVDAWAGTVDWKLSLARAVELSGEFYRGRAIGSLGGGAFKNYATYNSYASLRGLDTTGGWSQLKLILSPTIEMNFAGGQDGDFARELRYSDQAAGLDGYSNLVRNQSLYGNVVYKPRSYLLFSTEFRKLKSWNVDGDSNRDRMLGIAAGYSF